MGHVDNVHNPGYVVSVEDKRNVDNPGNVENPGYVCNESYVQTALQTGLVSNLDEDIDFSHLQQGVSRNVPLLPLVSQPHRGPPAQCAVQRLHSDVRRVRSQPLTC